ncbi:MAG: MFS transporter, partial [Janthinobacterium lividum]
LAAAFWFGVVVSVIAFGLVLLVVPRSSTRTAARLDVTGAALLAAGLVALLLAIAQGEEWGWSSPVELLLLAAAAVLLGVWVRHQLRCAAPIVQLRLLRHPAVLTGDGCAIVLGVAMYAYLSSVTEFVQTPRSAGYGFGASVVLAGLTLVPFSVVNFGASRALPWLTAQVGARRLLPSGCLVVAVSGVFFALWHDALWQAFVMMGVLGAGLGATFAMIPGLIVASVPDSETGSALGFYQVVRYIGFSLGSAVAAAVLAAATPLGSSLPTEGAYVRVLWVGVGICLAAAALAWLLPGHHRRPGMGEVTRMTREQDGPVRS